MNATEAGRIAKAEGHESPERDLPAYLNELFGGDHVVNGRPDTKVDVYDNETGVAYSVKNVSKNHTQVALSSRRFIEYFCLQGTDCETFVRMFFGIPNNLGMSLVHLQHPDIALSDAERRQNRVYASNIPQHIKDAFLDFMNANKMSVFDVIVRRGLNQRVIL